MVVLVRFRRQVGVKARPGRLWHASPHSGSWVFNAFWATNVGSKADLGVPLGRQGAPKIIIFRTKPRKYWKKVVANEVCEKVWKTQTNYKQISDFWEPCTLKNVVFP
jgi:hypothetical protein